MARLHLLLTGHLLLACAAASPSARSPTVVTANAPAQDTTPESHGVLVWGTHGKVSPKTYWLAPGSTTNELVGEADGIFVATASDIRKWETESVPLQTEPCDPSIGHASEAGVGDGFWGSYSVHAAIPGSPSAQLLPYAEPPGMVQSYLAEQSEFTLGGWSEVPAQAESATAARAYFEARSD